MPLIDELRKAIAPEMREGVPLAPFTTFRIGGPAEYYFEAKTDEEAVRAIAACRDLGLPYHVLGGGSNLLVSDDGIRGLTIRMVNSSVSVDGPVVTAGAGTPSGRLARETAEAGLSGLEWMIGLPGTVGGAIRGNAGMFGSEVKDSLESVSVLTPGGEARIMENRDCLFGYRDSAFKRLPGTVILSAKFRLTIGEAEACRKKMRGFLEKKTTAQPVSGLTAGCAFKNWLPKNEGEIVIVREGLGLAPEEAVPRTPTGAVPTGWIIDRAQLKGMRIGGGFVSEKHGNFIVNDGTGTASDVIALTAAVRMRVRDMTHGIILLEDEIEYVGF
ncbi:UDP-N-acetylmuramate dehydrogenase [Candidatus Uhrbacteria bacterium]|nr:UDP-N-acetylmuramate dehydrogenase [Candidatus Uhrbacteria bacterium]